MLIPILPFFGPIAPPPAQEAQTDDAKQPQMPPMPPVYQGFPMVNGEEAKPEGEMPIPPTPYNYAQGMPVAPNQQPPVPLYAGAPNVPNKDEE